MIKLYRNYRAINSLKKYFLNTVYCAVFIKVMWVLGMDTDNIHFKIGWCVYTGKVVEEYEGNMSMGQYCS